MRIPILIYTTDDYPALTDGKDRTDSKLSNYAHFGAGAQGLVYKLRCADRFRLLQVYLVRVGFRW